MDDRLLRRRLLIGAAVAAACFVVLWPLQTSGAMKPLNNWVEGGIQNHLERETTTTYYCSNHTCKTNPDPRMTWAYTTPRNGTFNDTAYGHRSILPWNGVPSQLGEGSAATAVMMASVVLLLFVGARRSALVGGALALLGGALVNPLKYEIAWTGRPPYPSGHTAGATLAWGFLLVFAMLALRRMGLVRVPLRWMLIAWSVVAFAVGFDRLTTHAHVLSDVLLGWSFAAAVVLFAAWLDATLAARADASEQAKAP